MRCPSLPIASPVRDVGAGEYTLRGSAIANGRGYLPTWPEVRTRYMVKSSASGHQANSNALGAIRTDPGGGGNDEFGDGCADVQGPSHSLYDHWRPTSVNFLPNCSTSVLIATIRPDGATEGVLSLAIREKSQ